MSGKLRVTEKADLPALAKFLVRAYKFAPTDFHFDPQFLEWKYLFPRPNWQGGRSYLLEREGKIVAHAGVCPVTFRLPAGQTVKSLTLLDWAADSTIPGAGVMLYRKLMQMAPTSFVIGGAAITREIVPRIGFRPVADAPTYAAWLHPWQEFRVRPRSGRSALRLVHGLTHPARIRRNTRFQAVPVKQFDDLVATVLTKKYSWTTCERSVSDLNYLLQCPYLETRGFILRRNDVVGGYFILGKLSWEGRLLDIGVDSESSSDWADAYAAVTNAALLDLELARLRTFATVPIVVDALRLNGYWRQNIEPTFLFDPADALRQAFPVGFQYFDSDSGY